MAAVSCLVRADWGGRPVANRLFFDVEQADATGLQALADEIGAAYDEALVPVMSSACELLDVLMRVFDGNPPFSTPYVPSGWPSSGTSAAEQLPKQVAPVVAFITGTGRPNRGRAYLFGLTEALWTGVEWSAAALTAFDAWGLAITGGSAGQLLVARPNYAANQVALANPVSEYQVRLYDGSQNRRRGF